jgi:hypothetical protein
MIIAGEGANAADLNIGGAGVVELNRTGGAAANNVKINGGDAIVRLVGTDQIAGDVIFGHRGGILDLCGNNFSRGDITHLDNGAIIANLNPDTVSTFTFTGSGAKTFLGTFVDSGSASGGLLNVEYNPTTASGSVWTLTGVNANAGTWDIRGGEVKVEGSLTLHAGGYENPDDWQTAWFETGKVTVAANATFTASHHATVASNVDVAAGGTFKIAAGAIHTGKVALTDASSRLITDTTAEEVIHHGTISGKGTVIGNISIAGILAPGNSIGTLNFTDNVTLTTGSKLIIEIDADTNLFDTLNFTGGTGSLIIESGAELQVVNIGTAPLIGEYQIITQAAGITGQNNLYYEDSLYSYSLDGTGKLTISAIPEPGTYGLLAGVGLVGLLVSRRMRKVSRFRETRS